MSKILRSFVATPHEYLDQPPAFSILLRRNVDPPKHSRVGAENILPPLAFHRQEESFHGRQRNTGIEFRYTLSTFDT
eukprot:5939195-Prymnesium_polylepis.1